MAQLAAAIGADFFQPFLPRSNQEFPPLSIVGSHRRCYPTKRPRASQAACYEFKEPRSGEELSVERVGCPITCKRSLEPSHRDLLTNMREIHKEKDHMRQISSTSFSTGRFFTAHMFVPTQHLSRLTIGGGMTPLTRSAAQRQRRERERAERQRAASAIAAQHASPAHYVPLVSRTGLQYDIRQLNAEACEKAMRGLLSEKFMLQYSRRVDQREKHGYYLGFEIKESAGVRIFDTGRPVRQLFCTCEEYGREYGGRNLEPAPPCVHIYWLYDRLNRVLGRVPNNASISLDRASIERRYLELFNDIEARINDLPDDLNQAENQDSEGEERSEQSDVDADIRDMLAVFSPDQFWDTFDDNFFSELSEPGESGFEDLVVAGDLQATVAALARHDPIFRNHLRNAVSNDVCIRDFFSKLSKECRSTFERFDDYSRRGPRLDARFIGTCGSRLREIISKISAYSQQFEAFLDFNFSRHSVILALSILDGVCERNRDIYEDSPWHTTEGDPEEVRDCNLFANLISDPDADHQVSLFILSFLFEDICRPALLGLIDRLRGIRQKLRQHGAPPAFLDEMANLIAELQVIKSQEEESDEDPGEGPSGSAPDDQLPRSRERRPTMEERSDPQQRRRLH